MAYQEYIGAEFARLDYASPFTLDDHKFALIMDRVLMS